MVFSHHDINLVDENINEIKNELLIYNVIIFDPRKTVLLLDRFTSYLCDKLYY